MEQGCDDHHILECNDRGDGFWVDARKFSVPLPRPTFLASDCADKDNHFDVICIGRTSETKMLSINVRRHKMSSLIEYNNAIVQHILIVALWGKRRWNTIAFIPKQMDSRNSELQRPRFGLSPRGCKILRWMGTPTLFMNILLHVAHDGHPNATLSPETGSHCIGYPAGI